MTIRFHCDRCQKRLKVADRFAGAAVKCPKCGHALVIPRPETSSQAGDRYPGDDAAEVETISVRRGEREDESMDLTPMVDVVFQLLIFFMVTATFALQKSHEVPPPDMTDSAAPTRTFEDLEEDDDFVIVRIDGDNTRWVDGAEALSEQDMLSKLREVRSGRGGRSVPSTLLVMPDDEADYELVIQAIDAGTAVGMENVRLANNTGDDF